MVWILTVFSFWVPPNVALVQIELPSPDGCAGTVQAVAECALPWTSGTSSSTSQAGTLLRRHMAGFYAAVDSWLGRRDSNPDCSVQSRV